MAINLTNIEAQTDDVYEDWTTLPQPVENLLNIVQMLFSPFWKRLKE